MDALNASEGLPVAFDRHVYFTDLERLYQRKVKVNYFSSLRDPIDRIVSQFYYARATPRPNLKLPPHLKTDPPSTCKFSKLEQDNSVSKILLLRSQISNDGGMHGSCRT